MKQNKAEDAAKLSQCKYELLFLWYNAVLFKFYPKSIMVF